MHGHTTLSTGPCTQVQAETNLFSHSQPRSWGSLLAQTQAIKSSLVASIHTDITPMSFIHDEKPTSFSGFSTWACCPFFTPHLHKAKPQVMGEGMRDRKSSGEKQDVVELQNPEQNVTDRGELSWHDQSRIGPCDPAASKGQSAPVWSIDLWNTQLAEILPGGVTTWAALHKLQVFIHYKQVKGKTWNGEHHTRCTGIRSSTSETAIPAIFPSPASASFSYRKWGRAIW